MWGTQTHQTNNQHHQETEGQEHENVADNQHVEHKKVQREVKEQDADYEEPRHVLGEVTGYAAAYQ